VEPSELNIPVITLYRYFAYAAQMRRLFVDSVDEGWLDVMTPDIQGMLAFFYSAPGIYLLYSYSGIYLVIEGWQDLGLRDDRIDKLLESPFVGRLRRFRNATFHYQKEPLSRKHLEFFGTEEEQTEEWLNMLYREFERFFAENTLPIPESLKTKMRSATPSAIARLVRDYWSSQPDDLDLFE
jgi:hypothetical protein